MDINLLEFLYLFAIYSNEDLGVNFDDVDEEKLQEKKLIKIINKKIILRQQSIDLIEFSLIEADVSFKQNKKKISKSSRTINKEVEKFVDEFRHKWHGRKAGAMGGKQACIQKLSRWMKENPEVTQEQILEAADLYLTSEGRNPQYLQRADYFIYKEDSTKEEGSRLSAYVDDIIMGHKEDDDWTTQLN
tara:strand:+ start:14553 stop:15119 length:567 start_codon:yes stop_codon:yes gene_type:complete